MKRNATTRELGWLVRSEREGLGWSRRELVDRSGVTFDVLRILEIGCIPILQDALDLLLFMEARIDRVQRADHLRHVEARRRLAAGED